MQILMPLAKNSPGSTQKRQLYGIHGFYHCTALSHCRSAQDDPCSLHLWLIEIITLMLQLILLQDFQQYESILQLITKYSP